MTSNRRSALEDLLASQIAALGLEPPAREHRFDPARRWRFDFAWPAHMLALEVEGGTWAVSRHTTGRGYEQDCEKYIAATLLGWRVLRVTSGMVHNGRAIAYLIRALGGAEHLQVDQECRLPCPSNSRDAFETK